MGKARLNKINQKYGPNEGNLNSNNSVQKEMQRAIKQTVKKQQQEVAVQRKVRKIVKKIRKVTDSAARKARRRIALVNDGSEDKMGTMLTDGLKKVDDFLNSLTVTDQNTNKDGKSSV